MGILEVTELRRTFGGIIALDSVSLSVTEGETTVIIGANGAGKTTLFNCITGYHMPDDGNVVFEGTDISQTPDYKVARMGIRRTFQEVDVFDELTVAENISLGAFQSNPRELMELLDLMEIHDKLGESLTLFERKRVALALAADGQLLLLDEVFSGLDPAEKPAMLEYLDALAEEKTLMLIEHDIETAFDLADNVVVLSQGRVLGQGTPEEIKEDEEVQEKYLGEMAL
ncbi:ATP-binding cassette domain-containing protein [Natronomonas sp. CBA1123]|jgi:branched-chain amino acid transport system ATP-binding protein|uniref:ABC transporter ATP-binding protein n=1 Tax=Natronomonas sp. CBA1123 TaxID=2668070 RepID=UPI0012E9C990|nr:ATP-binding cassette domain-containing protein [Natronomonas sp. CBA1123]MUV85358.1 ATP-binding cassette domain-containing protein [Natronomonas sp. CBA1123]